MLAGSINMSIARTSAVPTDVGGIVIKLLPRKLCTKLLCIFFSSSVEPLALKM